MGYIYIFLDRVLRITDSKFTIRNGICTSVKVLLNGVAMFDFIYIVCEGGDDEYHSTFLTNHHNFFSKQPRHESFASPLHAHVFV